MAEEVSWDAQVQGTTLSHPAKAVRLGKAQVKTTSNWRTAQAPYIWQVREVVCPAKPSDLASKARRVPEHLPNGRRDSTFLQCKGFETWKLLWEFGVAHRTRQVPLEMVGAAGSKEAVACAGKISWREGRSLVRLPKDPCGKSFHIFTSDFSTKSNSMLINQMISKNRGRSKGITSLEKYMNSSPKKVSFQQPGMGQHWRAQKISWHTEKWHSSDLALAIWKQPKPLYSQREKQVQKLSFPVVSINNNCCHTYTMYENIMQTSVEEKNWCLPSYVVFPVERHRWCKRGHMAGCSRGDMELQGHCQHLGNTCLGRDGHTAVLASTGTWKCGTPQQ